MADAEARVRLVAAEPRAVCPGGRVTVTGGPFPIEPPGPPRLWIGDREARLACASPRALAAIVPPGLEGGATPIRVQDAANSIPCIVGVPVATGLHQVDSPVFDNRGRLYVTYSGSRGQQVPVSVFRIGRDGARESLVTGLVNATSLAIGPDGAPYVSSRFEGAVYRIAEDGSLSAVVTDVGVACGIAFAPDHTLYVGDRSGTVFRVRDGKAIMLATLPPSVAAFHIAMGPDECLYVTGPTLTSRDRLYRVHRDGLVETLYEGFGRPQGLAFDGAGILHVVEALAGASGLYRLPPGGPPELVVSGEALVGVAFDPLGGLVAASNETAWRLDL